MQECSPQTFDHSDDQATPLDVVRIARRSNSYRSRTSREAHVQCSRKDTRNATKSQLPDRYHRFSYLARPKQHLQTTLKMVLSILIAAIIAPGLLGSQEAIRQSQSKEKREEHRARRCNLIATCVKSSGRSREINGRPVVLRNGKLWIDTGNEDGTPLGHMYAGYYLPYPDTKYEGLVTTITDVAPIMNWVYIDKETCEVKYGVRADAQPNLTGPFDCTRQDRRLTFDGWEGFCVVEEYPGLWALYFDIDDEGLKSKVATGTRVLEVELSRKEKRFQKEISSSQEDQTTKRAVDAQEEAPVDRPLAAEAIVSKPGVVDAQGDGQEHEAEVLRPLNIPQSIFDDPLPMVQPLVFRSRTPPPAYSPAEDQNTSEDKSTMAPSETQSSSMNESRPSAEGPQFVAKLNDLPSTPTRNASTSSVNNTSSTKHPRVSPSARVSLIPAHEKRGTPKLNRNSGTRALAQAQMFEAMAAQKIVKQEEPSISRQRISRASSSEYSNDGEDPDGPLLSRVGMVAQVPSIQKPSTPEKSTTKSPVTKSSALLALDSLLKTAEQRPITSPRKRAGTDPAIFGVQSAESGKAPAQSREATKLKAKPATSRGSDMEARLGSRSKSNQKPMSTRPRQISAPTKPPYPKIDSSQSSLRSTSRDTQSTTRKSLARTMTTGQRNQGMTNRIVGEKGRSNTVSGRLDSAQASRRIAAGRKTTSALFREIDELVKQDTSSEILMVSNKG
jgi:hypothetical protein